MKPLVTWGLVALALVGCGPPILLEPPPMYVRGKRIVFEENYNIGGNGGALWLSTTPYIYVHPDRFSELPNEMQWWVLGHELGHLTIPGISETGADCFGIRWIGSLGGLTDQTVLVIVEHVSQYHPSEVHPDGALRKVNILACVSGLDLLWSD